MAQVHKFTDLLSTKQAMKARKIVDFYDGKQEDYLINQLSDVHSGRRDWRARGIIPRTRNLVKMIINKSGLISNDKMPEIIVYVEAGSYEDEINTAKFNQLLLEADFEDQLRNIDPIVRALSTARWLIQFDELSGKFVFDILGLHNCATVLDQYRNVQTLIYRVSDCAYRVYTRELIQDILVDKDGKEIITNAIPNPYGIIPIATFNDMNKPRCSDWNEPTTDLVQLNELYNLHLTDSEFAIKHMKFGTWVTNCEVQGGQNSSANATVEVYNRNLPMQSSSQQQEVIIGPNSVINISSLGVDSPFFDWKSPQAELQPLDDIVSGWVNSFAADWSVSFKSGGEANATSGFQLIVEELPNLEMKRTRGKQFAQGLEEVFEIVRVIYNSYYPGTFTDLNKCKVSFPAPLLPVNETEDEQRWDLRINSGRATRLDYFMEKFDMTKEQAEEKIEEIDAIKIYEASPANVANIQEDIVIHENELLSNEDNEII